MKSIIAVAFASALVAAEPRPKDLFSVRSFHNPETTDKISLAPQPPDLPQPIVIHAADVPQNGQCAIPLLEFKPNWSAKKDPMAVFTGPVPSGGTVSPMPVCKGWK
jgi:hypothetical protein